MASQLPVEEASKQSSLDLSPADDLDVAPPADESTPVGEQKKAVRKRLWEGKDEQGEEGKKRRAASPLDRPSRERKSIERFAAMLPQRMSATKIVAVQQGSGEKLRDIPNVAFKLSKIKVDESLRVLHRVLFGKKGNAHYLKRNILQFSGFVWSENEKEKSKFQEKLNKLNKDRLLYFCNLLDIYSIKVNTKKEDISAKLLEFLESPHVTREVILAEKDKKGKKRRLGAKRTVGRALEVALPDKQRKKKKTDFKGEDEEGLSSSVQANKEVEDKGNSNAINDESSDETRSSDEGRSSDEEETSDLSKSKVKDEENELEPELTKELPYDGMNGKEEFEPEKNSPTLRKVSHAENKAGFPKDTKGSSKKSAKSNKGMQSSKKKKDTDSESKILSKSKASSSKDAKGSSNMKKDIVPEKIDSNDNVKRKVSMKVKDNSGIDSPKSKKDDEKKGKSPIDTASEDMRRNKKQNSKTESTKKGKEKIVSFVEPSSEQLSAAVSEIVKEVDFNVATLADIIRQLGARFDTDLMHRKAEIKHILQEVINNMTDNEEDGDDDDGDGGAKEGEKN